MEIRDTVHHRLLRILTQLDDVTLERDNALIAVSELRMALNRTLAYLPDVEIHRAKLVLTATELRIKS